MSRTAANLPFAVAEGTWLARVRVGPRYVSALKALSKGRSSGRSGGREWDTFLVAKRVRLTEIDVLSVYVAVTTVVPSRLT